MPIPLGAVPSLGDDDKLLNLRAALRNGLIDLVVELASSGDSKGPARLQIDSKNGTVTATIYDNSQNRFHLNITSKNGTVLVHLPPTYCGTVSTCLKNGRLTFSPGVRARLTKFSWKDKEKCFFIGDYPSSVYECEETWFGDRLRVELGNGTITVDFVDEESWYSLSGMNFFGRR